MSDRINIYLPDGYKEKLQFLAEQYTENGTIDPDQRGYPSMSKLIKLWVDQHDPEKLGDTPS